MSEPSNGSYLTTALRSWRELHPSVVYVGEGPCPLGAEAGVETLESVGGRGYATAAVAAWATAVRRRELLPLYSTSWENVASQRVAEKLGAVCYGEDWEIE